MDARTPIRKIPNEPGLRWLFSCHCPRWRDTIIYIVTIGIIRFEFIILLFFLFVSSVLYSPFPVFLPYFVLLSIFHDSYLLCWLLATLAVLKFFSWLLAFSSLIMICTGIVFLLFLVLEIYWHSCICGFIVFIIFRKIWVIISSNRFSRYLYVKLLRVITQLKDSLFIFF